MPPFDLLKMIDESAAKLDDGERATVDSLDNMFQIKSISSLLGVNADTVLSDTNLNRAMLADSLNAKLQERNLPKPPDKKPSPKPPPKPTKSTYGPPEELKGGHYWSFSESPVGMDIEGTRSGDRSWFMNPNISFREWYSDVGRGTVEATLFGKPTKGISKGAPLYDPSGEPGEEKYNEKYVGELIRRMNMLEDPEHMITRQHGGRQLSRIDDEYERMFSEDLAWQKNLPQHEWRNVKGGGTIEDFVGRPEYEKAVFIEKSKYYNEALNALQNLPDDSPSAQKLSSFIKEDSWKVFDPDYVPDRKPFLPIPEEIADMGWGRNPFVAIEDSLDALDEYTSTIDGPFIAYE